MSEWKGECRAFTFVSGTACIAASANVYEGVYVGFQVKCWRVNRIFNEYFEGFNSMLKRVCRIALIVFCK